MPSLASPLAQPARPRALRNAGPGTRPLPDCRACSSRPAAARGTLGHSPGKGKPRSSWFWRCSCRRRERCCRSQRSPWLSPGLAGAPGARGSRAAGISGCFCPAPHPPPPPGPGAHLPPTPPMHCGSRAAGQRREVATKALGLLSTCLAARPLRRGEAAAAATGASQCSPPTAAAEN